jgi:hypothetical protein
MSRDVRRRPRLAAASTMVLAALLLAACASPKRAMSYEHIDQRKQEIAMLWAQVREWRQNAGLRGVEPPAREIIKMQGQPMSSATRVCPAPVEPRTDRCTDLCSLADAICENAESICRIADELGEDIWAQDKCSSAKASCKEAKKECCRCCSEEPPTEAGMPGMPPGVPAAPLPADPAE